MRIVAVLSMAFVVLVGVVAVTYPNESDEVRQRNAAFMKLGDIKGESVKADLEQGDTNQVLVCFKDAAGLQACGLLTDIDPGFDGEDMNQVTICARDEAGNFRVTNACGILPYLDVEPPSFDAVCQDLNQISRIVESLDAKNPVAADLRTALERTQNNLKDVIIVSAANYHHAGGGILGSCGLVMDGEDAGDGDFWGSNRES